MPPSSFIAPPPPVFAAQLRPVSTGIFRLAQVVVRVPPAVALPAPPPPPSSSSNLRVVRVRGDGRCLFRAIAKNLAAADARVLPENLEREDADALRAFAWKAICVNRRNEFVKRHVIEGSIDSYCAQSRNPTFYGGEAELLALADVLKRPIRVFLRTDTGLRNIMTYGEAYAKKTRVKKGDGAIRLLYVNGNHYDAILPR